MSIGALPSRLHGAIDFAVHRHVPRPRSRQGGWPASRHVFGPSTSASIPDISASVWYDVAPIFPGVTQRMVNMAGERLTRLSTPRGFLILRADHLEFRPGPRESGPHAGAGSIA